MPKILVVDDDDSVRDSVLCSLGFDYSVAVAVSGADALKQLSEAREEGHPFDLVLTDYRMPGMSGVQLLAAMRAAGDVTPAILHTGTRYEAERDLLCLGLEKVAPVVSKGSSPHVLDAQIRLTLGLQLHKPSTDITNGTVSERAEPGSEQAR